MAPQPASRAALRAAIAAAIAWAVAGVLPAPATDYPYYAPFGAVIATTFTLAGSVRESAQAVGAIAVGGAVGWVIDVLPITSGPLAVALVVVPSVLLAGWRRLGAMGGWVPTAALFTLIIGHGDATYIGAYAGLTLVGALIGIAVNAIFPPLPLAPAQSAVGLFRRTLAADLDEIADLLEGEERPTVVDWSATTRQRHRIAPACTPPSRRSGRRPAQPASAQVQRFDRRAAARGADAGPARPRRQRPRRPAGRRRRRRHRRPVRRAGGRHPGTDLRGAAHHLPSPGGHLRRRHRRPVPGRRRESHVQRPGSRRRGRRPGPRAAAGRRAARRRDPHLAQARRRLPEIERTD